MIRSMFQQIVNGEQMPDEWKQAHITSIFKKGNRKTCENYRVISVIATMGRVYGKPIRNKIEENIEGEMGEKQAGFTVGRSIMDYIQANSNSRDTMEISGTVRDR
ncbi:hypothetical protein PPYR_08291 [Photinus pyralis]|uniref:Reverse transcriptase domain-containing protein n=1 Tax=Photinus pyralis TaxID=7054 RepID=A0A1Y1LB31_PHOPY|nr:hypothetical protein PPYR_08291 [Photinus pyralis]